MNKKLLVSIGIILLFAISGVVIYYYFFAQKPAPLEEDFGLTDLTPFGGGFSETSEPEKESFGGGEQGEVVNLPALRKISSAPVAGAVVFNRNAEVLTRYIERATGHIYEASLSNTESARISNTTVPKIYEAIWSATGKEIFVRYIKDDQTQIETFSIKVSTSSPDSETALQGTFFPRNIPALAVNPAGDRVFYILTDINGSTGFVSRLDGSQKASVWSSPAKEWLVSWPSENTIVLVTKPSALATGFVYFLNIKTEKFERILGDIRGLNAVLSLDRAFVLHSGSKNSKRQLSVLELKTGKTIAVPLETFSDKCVWQNSDVVYCAVPKNLESGDYPDIWYQGLIGFSDDIWKFDVSTGSTDLVISLDEAGGEAIDVVSPQINRTGDTMIFINKNNLSLWSLSLLNNRSN